MPGVSSPQQPVQVLTGQKGAFVAGDQEWFHIRYNLLPGDLHQVGAQGFPPGLRCQPRAIPACLRQGIVEQGQVGGWPLGGAQIPGQVVQVASLQVRSLQQGVQFPG